MGILLYFWFGNRAGRQAHNGKARNRAFNRFGYSAKNHWMGGGFLDCINRNGDSIDRCVAIYFTHFDNFPYQWCLNNIHRDLFREKNLVLQS